MRIQAIAISITGVAISLSPAAWYGLAVGLAVGAWSVYLRHHYLRSRRGRVPRPDDTLVSLETLATFTIPAGASLAGINVPAMRVFHPTSAGVLIAALLTLSAGLFASSLVDWYYVRPRVDGVLRLPPCRSSGDDVWLTVSRAVFAHRLVAEVITVVSIVVTATAGVVLATAPPAAAVGTIAGVATVGVAALLQRAVQTLQSYAVNKPWVAIGDVVAESDGSCHYIAEIASTAVYVRTKTSSGWSRLRPLSLRRLENDSLELRSENQCGDRCLRLNANCAETTACHDSMRSA